MSLNKIRGSALGCQYKIPAPPAGGSVDFTKVNVQFSTTGGEVHILTGCMTIVK